MLNGGAGMVAPPAACVMLGDERRPALSPVVVNRVLNRPSGQLGGARKAPRCLLDGFSFFFFLSSCWKRKLADRRPGLTRWVGRGTMCWGGADRPEANPAAATSGLGGAYLISDTRKAQQVGMLIDPLRIAYVLLRYV